MLGSQVSPYSVHMVVLWISLRFEHSVGRVRRGFRFALNILWGVYGKFMVCMCHRFVLKQAKNNKPYTSRALFKVS